MYHVATEHNSADCGTRPTQVTAEDITQCSMWISGAEWMKHGIHNAVKKGILKPVSVVWSLTLDLYCIRVWETSSLDGSYESKR